MTRFFKSSLTAAVALISICGAAQSETVEHTFDVDFYYTAGAPTEQIYSEFNQTALTACREELRGVTSPNVRRRFLKSCRADLVNKVVMASGMPDLIVLHGEETGAPVSAAVFAQLSE